MEAYFKSTGRKIQRPKKTFKANRAQKRHMETVQELAQQRNAQQHK